MKLTYQNFLQFCSKFEELNEFEFEEESVQNSNDNPKECYYDATYRDECNYKSNVRIFFLEGSVRWEVAAGWDEAYEELDRIYLEEFQCKVNEQTEEMKYVYRLSYVILGKYDLFFVEEALDENHAKIQARKEMIKDQIPLQDCKLMQVEMIRPVVNK